MRSASPRPNPRLRPRTSPRDRYATQFQRAGIADSQFADRDGDAALGEVWEHALPGGTFQNPAPLVASGGAGAAA